MLKLAIIFWLANSATGSKVKERFDYEHLSRTPVRIMAPALTPNKDAEVRMKAMFTEAYAEFFPRANFTSVFADTFIVGYRGEDGNYTGMVGELINHRADYVINFAMLSQHQDEPVRVGVALLQADLKIFTDDWKSEIIAVDFLHTFQNVRSEFGIWLFLSFHIVAVTYVWFDSHDFNIANYAVIYWFGMLTMLDQEGLSCSKWKPRFLWFFTCVAISIVVFGYILNLMSSDSIVIRDPPRINSIDDMFIKPFSSFKVYMYTTTTFYNYMRNARPGTKMAAIYKRAADRANCSRLIDCGEIEFRSDPQGSLKLLEFYDELMATRDHALLTSDMVMVQVTAPSVCRFRPELYNTTYTSTEHIATDILTFIARKGIDSQAEKYLNFRMQTSFAESGLTQIFPLIYIDAVFEEMMPHVAKRNAQYYRCVESWKREDDQDVLPLSIKQRRKLVIFIACLMGSFTLLLLAERLYYSKPRKQSTVTKLSRQRPTLQLPRNRRIPFQSHYISQPARYGERRNESSLFRTFAGSHISSQFFY